jgi:formamidopyrimidine-DNA glycosylase
VPELPEVETIVRDLRPRLIGRTLRRPRLYHRDVLRGVSTSRLLDILRNNTVRALDRRAKHLVLRLASGERVIIQLRMTGSLQILDRRLNAVERRYAVLVASIGGGSRLVFRDVRRLGTIQLLSEPQWHRYTAAIGPEPLAARFTGADFRERLRPSRQAIKKAIMDQRRLAGVGNIYANEALFLARIDPSRPANSLTHREYSALFRAVRRVLRAAIDHGGTTVRDYRNGTGQPGSFQHALLVYDRAGDPCVRCGHRLATTHAIDGRQTTFCWHCQGTDSDRNAKRA